MGEREWGGVRERYRGRGRRECSQGRCRGKVFLNKALPTGDTRHSGVTVGHVTGT
jgi:hypothetical protein